jgi:cytosine/uracil/thiamine/allantoin permease
MKKIIKKTIQGCFYLENCGHHPGNFIAMAFFTLFSVLSVTEKFADKLIPLWSFYSFIIIGYLYCAYQRSLDEEELESYLRNIRKRRNENKDI